jgi:ferric-dicitrate binding protein FerR (iron transport regulator)
MNRGMEHDLIRLLHGELAEGEARELRARMLREPGLAEAFRRLERTWNGLEPPPPSPVPPGFAGRVMARARAEGPTGALSWSGTPGWVRATAAAALIVGAALGAGVGRSWPSAEPEENGLQASVSIAEESEYSLTGSYWELVDETTGEEVEQ